MEISKMPLKAFCACLLFSAFSGGASFAENRDPGFWLVLLDECLGKFREPKIPLAQTGFGDDAAFSNWPREEHQWSASEDLVKRAYFASDHGYQVNVHWSYSKGIVSHCSGFPRFDLDTAEIKNAAATWAASGINDSRLAPAFRNDDGNWSYTYCEGGHFASIVLDFSLDRRPKFVAERIEETAATCT